jgi:hypothetical protein
MRFHLEDRWRPRTDPSAVTLVPSQKIYPCSWLRRWKRVDKPPRECTMPATTNHNQPITTNPCQGGSVKHVIASFLVGAVVPFVHANPLVTWHQRQGAPQDTCTTNVTCQISTTISGQWDTQSVVGGGQTPGYCTCDDVTHDCVTHHCKVDFKVRPQCNSWKVDANSPCNPGQPAFFELIVKQCGNHASKTYLTFSSADCSGFGTWMSYLVTCDSDTCGDKVCPQNPQ